MQLTIGEAVKLIRLARGDSLRQMAPMVDVSHVNLSKIERNVHQPSLALCQHIYDECGVCPVVLARWTDLRFDPETYWRFLADNLLIRKQMIAEKEFGGGKYEQE